MIDRMKDALRDIIDMCNTDPCLWRADTTEEDWQKLIAKIEDTAHRGLYGNQQQD